MNIRHGYDTRVCWLAGALVHISFYKTVMCARGGVVGVPDSLLRWGRFMCELPARACLRACVRLAWLPGRCGDLGCTRAALGTTGRCALHGPGSRRCDEPGCGRPCKDATAKCAAHSPHVAFQGNAFPAAPHVLPGVAAAPASAACLTGTHAPALPQPPPAGYRHYSGVQPLYAAQPAALYHYHPPAPTLAPQMLRAKAPVARPAVPAVPAVQPPIAPAPYAAPHAAQPTPVQPAWASPRAALPLVPVPAAHAPPVETAHPASPVAQPPMQPHYAPPVPHAHAAAHTQHAAELAHPPSQADVMAAAAVPHPSAFPAAAPATANGTDETDGTAV